MSNSMDKHRLLHHLDDPLRILKWTIDEAFALIVPSLVLGVGFGRPFTAIIVGLGSYWLLRELKKRFGKKVLQPLLYWYFPPTKRFKKLPLSYIREYFG